MPSRSNIAQLSGDGNSASRDASHRRGLRGSSTSSPFKRQGTDGSADHPPQRADTVEPSHFQIPPHESEPEAFHNKNNTEGDNTSHDMAAGESEKEAAKGSGRVPHGMAPSEESGVGGHEPKKVGPIEIVIPPNTPSVGFVALPPADFVPLQPPRHGNAPLTTYQQYQQADGGSSNSASAQSRQRSHAVGLPAPSVFPVTFSQQLRASVSRPTSPDGNTPMPQRGASVASASAIPPRLQSILAPSDLGRTPIGMRGTRTRSQTVALPDGPHAPRVGQSSSGASRDLQGASGSFGGPQSSHSASNDPMPPHKASALCVDGSRSNRQPNNLSTTTSASTGQADDTSQGFAGGQGFGGWRNAPGFDRNQQTTVFVSPSHYDGLVIPIGPTDTQPHRFRGKTGEGGLGGPLFSALGGAGGSPVFGPVGSPSGAIPHTSAAPLASNFNLEGDAPQSVYDPLAVSQKEGHVGGQGRNVQDIFETLTKRRYLLPAKAAAHVVAVANDNMASAGLSGAMSLKAQLGLGGTASTILDVLRGNTGAPGLASVPPRQQPPSSGDNSSAPTGAASCANISPLTPASAAAVGSGTGRGMLFPSATASSPGAMVHVVPLEGRGGVPDGPLPREDPLYMATFTTTGSGGNRISRPTTLSSTGSGKHSSNVDESVLLHATLDGPQYGGTPVGRQQHPQTLAAVHRYHSPAMVTKGAARGPGGAVSFYGYANETVPPSMVAGPDNTLPDPVSVAGSPRVPISSPVGGSVDIAHNASYRYAPLYYNLDTNLAAVHSSQTHPRVKGPPTVPMPSFDPMEGGEYYPDTSSEEDAAEDTLVFGPEGAVNTNTDEHMGLQFRAKGRGRRRQRRTSNGLGGLGSISAGDDAPPLIVAARRAAEAAKKRQRRKERRENPPFQIGDPPYAISNEPNVGVQKAIMTPKARLGSSRYMMPASSVMPLWYHPILPSTVSSPGAVPIPPTAAQLASLVYTHPLRDPLSTLLRRVSPLSVPLTWLLELRREDERFFTNGATLTSARMGLLPANGRADELSLGQKVSVLQNMPGPPFLSHKAIACETILDAPAAHGLFASFERSGTLMELARFCRLYPDALHFLEKVLHEVDDPRSTSNKALAFKKTSLAKDIIEGRERRRQRRMEKKGRVGAGASASPSPKSPIDGLDSSLSMNSSDDEASDLEDLMLSNLGTNSAYQMDVVLPLFPQLEDVVTLLKASCETVGEQDSEEARRDVEAASVTVERLISALDPALHTEPSLSWPFHVLCSLVCFYVTALRVGFVPLFKSLRKGSLASSGKGILAALAVSLSCKECLTVDDISGFDPEPPATTQSPPRRPRYNPADPFHYTNRNSEAEGRFYTDEDHQYHDLALRKFLCSEASDIIPKGEDIGEGFEEARISNFISRRIRAVRAIRARHFRQRLTEIGACPSRFCSILPTTTDEGYYTTSVLPGRRRPMTQTTRRGAVAAPSFHTIATVADDYYSFEQNYGVRLGESDAEEESVINVANAFGAGIELPSQMPASMSHATRKEEDEARRRQIIALQNERCEVIFFKHCVEALRAAQGVGLSLESLRATNNIKPTTLLAPDGSIIEPDDNEEGSIAAAAESGTDGSESDDGGVPLGNSMRSRGHRRKSFKVSSPRAQAKDTIANANSKCAILVVNLDVTSLKLLITAVNDGRSSWVGVESSRQKRGAGVGDPALEALLSDTMPNEGDEERLAQHLKTRQKVTLAAADNPNSATRGASSVVGRIEIARILCSRSSVVTGHPADIARLDLVLIQYGAFTGEKIHRDKLPIEAPENHTVYCGEMLQAAIMRVWKGVQHGYTYRADYNRLVAQRRRARTLARIQRRENKLAAREASRRRREEAREARRRRNEEAGRMIDFGVDTSSDSSSGSSTQSDDAEIHYYADLAALAGDQTHLNGSSEADGSAAGNNQDLHDFERATRFFLSFLVHPSEMGIDMLHPVTGESMRWIRGGLTEPNAAKHRGVKTSGSGGGGNKCDVSIDDGADDGYDLVFNNNDPSAQYRARFGGGYMNKARLKDAWVFMESIANAISVSRQNLPASVDIIKQRGALRQRQNASKREEGDEVAYAAGRQAVYDGILREASLVGDSGESPPPNGFAAAALGAMDPPRPVQPEWKPPGSIGSSGGAFGNNSQQPVFSQAAVASCRYLHSKDLLLDFSFARLRVGQVLAWAQGSTAVGAFVSRNATNSSANDVVCVPQPSDITEQVGALLKPPRRGTRQDVVSRTWLQIGILNQALSTFVPQVVVTETTTTTRGGDGPPRSSLAIASERIQQIRETQAIVQRNVYDVADARLLNHDGTPRIYSVTDNFLQFQMLRNVFFHAVDARPVSKSAERAPTLETPGTRNGPLTSDRGAEGVATTHLLTAMNAMDRVQMETDGSAAEEGSDGGDGEEAVCHSVPSFKNLLSPSSGTITKDAFGSLRMDTAPASAPAKSLAVRVSMARSPSELGSESDLQVQPGQTDVGHLLCFLDSLSGTFNEDSPLGDCSKSLRRPVGVSQGVGSPFAASLLASFDATVMGSLPLGGHQHGVSAGMEKPVGAYRKASLARRALRSFVASSPHEQSLRNRRSASGGSPAHHDPTPRCYQTRLFGNTSVHPNNSSINNSATLSNTSPALSAAPVPIIDMGFDGKLAEAGGYDAHGASVGAHRAAIGEIAPLKIAAVSAKAPAHLRARNAHKAAVAKANTQRAHGDRAPMVGAILTGSRYRAWVEEGVDFGDGTLARRRRIGVELALSPSFTCHLMNIERFQLLSLHKGLRYLERRQRQTEEYYAKYSGNNDVTAIPAPPVPPPYTGDALRQEFSCNWLRTLLVAASETMSSLGHVNGDAGGAARKGPVYTSDNRLAPKVAIVEAFSATSYDTLKKLCEYDQADSLINCGGGSLLTAGVTAAVLDASRSSRSMRTPQPTLGGGSCTRELMAYLEGMFMLYLGNAPSDVIRDVVAVSRVHASPPDEPSPPQMSTYLDGDAMNTLAKSPVGAESSHVIGSSGERRTADALKALKNAPPVTVIPLGGTLERNSQAMSGTPRDRELSRGEGEADGGGWTNTTYPSRAPSPSVLFTNVANAIKQNAAPKAVPMGSSTGSDPTQCQYCGARIANARALRIHTSYCEGASGGANPSSMAPSPGVTPSTSPQMGPHGSPTSHALGLSRPPSLANMMAVGSHPSGNSVTPQAPYGRPSPLATPVGPTGGGFERLIQGLAGGGSRSESVASQQRDYAGNAALVGRTLSSSSSQNLVRGEGDATRPCSGGGGVVIVDVRGNVPAGHPSLLPKPMGTPLDAVQADRLGVFPGQGGGPSVPLTASAGPSPSSRSAITIERVQQATVLHAVLLGAKGRAVTDPATAGNASPLWTGMSDGVAPHSPAPPVVACGATPGHHSPHEKSSVVVTSTISQPEPITVIDAASATATYGSSALGDGAEVLGGYQFLCLNPTLKNESDAVVLDLLQYIGSLRGNLLMKQEQLYQQVLVAYHHLQQLRNVTLCNPSQTVAAPAEDDGASKPPLEDSYSHSLGDASPQTPTSPPGATPDASVRQLMSNPHAHIVLLTHHIRQLLTTIEGVKRRREVLRQVAGNYHRVKTGLMLTPQAVHFIDNLCKLTDLPFPPYTLLLCPTVLQLLDFWDALEFSTFYCGC